MNLRWLAFLFLFAGPAFAQNVNCATRPVGDTSNACASTAFVQSAIGPGGSLQINSTLQFDGSGKLGLANAAANSVLCNATGSAAAPIGCTTLPSGLTIPSPNLTLASTAFSQQQITVSAAPSYTGPADATDYFNGDFSHTILGSTYTVTGSCTLGCPSTGYQNNPAVTPLNFLVVNSSGHNESTSTNDGRTSLIDLLIDNFQNGQGDHVGLEINCSAGGTELPSESNFLAGKACVGYNGNFGATADGAYAQPLGDLNCKDNGFRMACIGLTMDFTRTNNTITEGQVWLGSYMNSQPSTKAIDCVYCAAGPAIVGADFTQSTGLSAALNLGAGEKIVFNSTATAIGGINWYGNTIGNASIFYASSEIELCVSGGSTCLNVQEAGGIDSTGYINASGQVIGFNFVANGAALTTSSGQIGYGGTVETPGSGGCPASGVTGCIIVNIAGTQRAISYN